MDIHAYYRGEISSRRMLNFIRRLPADSQLSRDTHGEQAQWSRTDHLLAIACDRLAELTWLFICANSDDQPDRPEPIPRPGSDPADLESSSTADQAAFFSS